MKKLILLVLVLALCCGNAYASGIDWDNLEDFVLIDDENVKCYLTGSHSTLGSKEDEYYCLSLDAVVENNSDKMVNINCQTCTVNGWQVYGGGVNNTLAGKKQKFQMDIYLDQAEIYSLNEIEDIEMTFNMTSEDFMVFWVGETLKLPTVE